MAFGLLPEKIKQDIEECIAELRKDYHEFKIPINDDNTTLHRFSSKLEFLLQNGMKEHSNLLGTKKDYWDYFCQCLISAHGGIHDGLKFVKSLSEIKTSLGRGRAFIRFCLMHQCLADSLQCCCMNKKITSKWYYERSILTQERPLSQLISALYELNDVQFDLTPRGEDLDVSWPTFSRKLFGSPHTWQPPSRSISISSLVSHISQNESSLAQVHSNDISEINKLDELKEEISCLKKKLEELQRQLKETEIKEEQSKNLADEKAKQLLDITNQLETERSSNEMHTVHLKEKAVELEEKWQLEKNELNENLNNYIKNASEHSDIIKKLTLDIESKEEKYRIDCNKHQEIIEHLKKENIDLISHSSQLEGNLKKHQESLTSYELKIKNLEELMSELKKENQNLKTKIKDHSETVKTKEIPDISKSKQYRELEHKFKLTEITLRTTKVEMNHLQRNLNKSEELNEISTKLADTLETECSKLREQICIMENNIKQTNVNLEECQRANINLENEILEVKSELKDTVENKNKVEIELQLIKQFPKELIVIIEKIIESQQFELTDFDKLCKWNSIDCSSKKQLHSIFQLIVKNCNKQNNSNQLPSSTQQNVVLNFDESILILCKKQTFKMEELHKELDACLQESLKLNCQMCVLRDMLHLNETINIIKPVHEEYDLIDDIEENNLNINCTSLDNSSIKIFIDEMNNNAIKLNKLAVKTHRLCNDLETFRNINHKLVAKVQEQERKLSGVTQELESTKKFVSTLKIELNKLQTTEAIAHYELKEKRKLLTRLRTQLESTKEDWNRMRKNYSDSEADFQSLRSEFAQRHKQASEESGFVDDKSTAGDSNNSETIDMANRDYLSASSPIDISESSQHDDSQMTDCSIPLSSSCEGAEGGIIEEVSEVQEISKTRLEILEEQCQLLYQSLVHSATKSDNLQQRVQSLFRNHSNSSDTKLGESSTSNLPQQNNVNNLSTEQNCSQTVENNQLTDLDNRTEQISVISEHLPVDDLTSDIPLEETIQNVSQTEVSENLEASGITLTNAYDSSDSSSDEDNSMEQEYTQTIQDLRRKALDNLVCRLRNERLQCESRETDLVSQIETLKVKNLQLEKTIEKLKKEKYDLIAKEEDFRKRSEYIFRKERENFNIQVNDIDTERSSLEKKVEELTQKLEESTSKINELEKVHNQTIEEFKQTQHLKEEEISALQFQLSTETIKYERSLKHYVEQGNEISTMRKQINEQEQIISFLEETLLEIKEEREIEKQHNWHELEELQLSLSIRDEECTKMNEDLKQIVIELDNEKQLSNKLQTALEEMKKQNDSNTLELTQLRNDNKELKKKVFKLIKTKDILWKHSEKLSHQQKIQVTDRWMEDVETNNCLGCKILFSFTVRKHHCRLCGRIFCHSCANNWLLTASSRRQARVCNECYIQHVELQTEVKKSSSMPNVIEDSEDDEDHGIPIASNSLPINQISLSSNNSLDSDNLSSLIDNASISSLPVCNLEKSAILVSDVVPMYGSVPDLSSCYKNRKYSHDNQLTQENKESVFQFASDNITNKNITREVLHEEFDVISDEEIARSLSSCNPYSPIKKMESILYMTITRNASAIETSGPDGVKGELWVNAGTQYGVPVICDDPGYILNWEFSTEPQRINFSLLYKKSKNNVYNKSEMQTLHETHFNSSQHSVKGHVIMKQAGVYILIFDNRFSKVAAKKVKYFLSVHLVDAVNPKTEKET